MLLRLITNSKATRRALIIILKAMLAAIQELEDSKTRVLKEMNAELNINKSSLQQGIDAAQKAIADQDK